MNTVLVTGAAGFVGFHISRRWLQEGWSVVGLDAMTDYYDPKLKRSRLKILEQEPAFTFAEARVETPNVLAELIGAHSPSHVIHLAAQAGVRHSIEAPRDYLSANVAGTFELLEAARAHPGCQLLIASTSSVYGANEKMPYSEGDKADSPMSFYAATKKSTEVMAHSYAHLYDIPITLFRFFTVYGPWGRPDMALFKFTKAIFEDRPIDVYNHGQMKRDFTYIEDLVEAVWRLAQAAPHRGDGPQSTVAPYRVVNIGKAAPDALGDFITEIETAIGRPALKNFKEMQPGDVPATHSDTDFLAELTGYRCTTPLSEGIPKFIDWYRSYYSV